MIGKIGSVFLDKSKISKLHKISNIAFIVAIFFFFTFPFWQEMFYINEKQLKASNNHANDLKEDLVVENINFLSKNKMIKNEKMDLSENVGLDLLKKLDSENALNIQNIKDYALETNIFSSIATIFKNIKLLTKNFDIVDVIDDTNKNNIRTILEIHKMLSYKIFSPRGDRTRSIIINFVIEPKNINVYDLVVINTLLSYLQIEDNITWLAKDVYVNILSYDLFYNKVNLMKDFLKNNDYFQDSGRIDFIVNLDLKNLEEVSLSYSGSNSETIDMDFLKLVYDNLAMGMDEKDISLIHRYYDYYSPLDSFVNYLAKYADNFEFLKPYSFITFVGLIIKTL